MNVTLYDSKTSLPEDMHQHIFVFTGFARCPEEAKPKIVTEVHCTYCVGDLVIEYRKNSDAGTQRFEEALSWAVRQAEALGIAERFASLDPLSGLAHAGLSEALKSTGRRTQALASLKIAEQLGFSPATWELGNLNLEAKRDEIAITYFESALRNRNLPTEWVRRLVVRGRDPATGQAHVDHLLSQLEVPFPFVYSEGYSRFYLALGFLDRFFEVISELGVSDPGWSSAEDLSYWGTIDRRSGFTAHPRYLELAEKFDLTELWDQRGAPDHCKKLDGQWVCK